MSKQPVIRLGTPRRRRRAPRQRHYLVWLVMPDGNYLRVRLPVGPGVTLSEEEACEAARRVAVAEHGPDAAGWASAGYERGR